MYININELNKKNQLSLPFLKKHGVTNGKEYLDLWLEIFIKTSTSCPTSNSFNHGQIFSKQMIFDTFSFSFNFNINVILNQMKIAQTQTQVLPISLFTSENAKTEFTYIDAVKFEHFNKAPIIIIPFTYANNWNLVVDGNHRLSCCIKYNIPSVSAYCFQNISAICSSLSSEFEKAYYSFIFDTWAVSQLPLEGIAHIDLSKSLIKNFL